MVTLFKRPGAEEGLDARIAGLRRARGEPDVPEKAAPPPPPPDNTAAPGAPATPEPAASVDGSGVRQLPGRRAAVEAAKAQIQPLVLEHMDVAAAAEMPRAAFEAQLTGWVKELLAETKIQLNFVEQRELVDSLVADMLGLGPLEPLIADETVNDIMVNGPKQVYVERRGKLELTDVQFRDHAHLMNVATKIVTRVGRP